MIPPETNIKILETNKGNVCSGVSFHKVQLGRLDSSNFLEGMLLKTFFWSFLTSVFPISHEKIFFLIFRYSGLHGCSVREKNDSFAKIFYNLQNFKTLFPLWILILVQSLLRWQVIGCIPATVGVSCKETPLNTFF